MINEENITKMYILLFFQLVYKIKRKKESKKKRVIENE